MNTRLKEVLWKPSLYCIAILVPIVLLAVNALGQPPTNCVTPPTGLVSWWRGESNSLDARDGNHGTNIGNVTFGAGRVGQAFVFDGLHDAVSVGNPANLQLQNFTIEGWIKRGNTSVVSQEPWGALFFGYAWGGYGFGIIDDGTLFLGKVGYSHVMATNLLVTDTNWHYVAATKNGSNVVIYLDGVSQPLGPYDPGFVFNADAVIGARGDDYVGGFLGSIDEVSVYNRALPGNEVLSIYNAGVNGKCLSNTGAPPSIVNHPQSQTVNAGGNVSFNVVALGSQPLSYQWRFNNTNIAGATGTSLSLSNVQISQAGGYSVRVTNLFGSVFSTNAFLTVLQPSNNCVAPPAGLVSWWRAESNALDANDGNHGTLSNGTTFASGKVGQSFQFDGVNGAVVIPAATNLAFTSVTVEGWILPFDRITQRPIVEYADPTGPASMVLWYNIDQAINPNPGGLLAFLRRADNSASVAVSSAPGLLISNQWNHVALTYDFALRRLSLYHNGVAVGVATSSVPIQAQSFVNVNLGYRPVGSSELFAGYRHVGGLDEVSIYNRALTAGEIQAVYNAGGAGKCLSNTGAPPSIVTQPQSQMVNAGGNVSFNVVALGSQPLSYQWRFNNTNIAGATGTSLSLSNVQAANAGNYSVRVTNLFGTVFSSNALLTLTPTSTNCVTAPSGLVSWWRGEVNNLDAADGNFGTNLGNTTYGPGRVGQAFVFDGYRDAVTVGNPPNLQLQNFTIEAWIKRGTTLIASQDPWDSGAFFAYAWGGYGFGVTDNGTLFLTKVGYSHVMANSLLVTDTNWHFVAVTKNGSNVVIYLDGASQALGPYDPGFVFNADAVIGARGDDYVSSFLGSVDEISIYNRALSAGELASIYNAGAGGKCFSNTGAPPSIVTQPQNRIVNVGTNISFSVVAVGAPPLNYQWRFNGTNIVGATGSSLFLFNVQPANAGNYSVRVTNLFGSVISSNALLTVIQPTNCVPPREGLVSWWRGESNSLDARDGNNGTNIGNVSYGPGRVGQAFVLDGNHDAVSVGNPANLQLQNFTIEAWVKRGNTSIVSQEPWGSLFFGYAWGGYGFGILDDGTLFLSKVGYSHVMANLFVTDTNWHYVACTKNGSNVVIYLDGASQALGPYDPGFVFNADAVIGARGDDYVGSFLGAIDEVSVYNRALAGSELLAIYNAGSGGKCLSNTGAPPSIVTQPQSQVVDLGANVSFNVVAAGSQPLSYQWRFNGTNIVGATGTSLAVSNVLVRDAGNYSVRVTNAFGSVISSNALLAFKEPPTPTNCIAAPSGLVSWWRGEGNSSDARDGNPGTNIGNVTYGPGRVGQAFVFDGNHDAVTVGNPANLRLQNFTIDAWIKRGNSSIVSQEPWGAPFFAYAWGGYGFGIIDDGTLFLSKVGYSHVMATSLLVTDTNWHYVACTKNGSNVVIYLDGVSQALGPYDPGFVFNADAVIGARGDDYVSSFLGAIDEVSVYNRPLSGSELLSIYNAGSGGKCLSNTGAPPSIVTQPQSQLVNAGANVTFNVVAAGSFPLSYQWRFNGTNIAGATGTSLALFNVQAANAGNYSVRVTNLFGSVFSSNALLSLTQPPTPTNCVTPPSGLVSWWRGESNSLDARDGNHGTNIGNVTYGAGRVGQAFVFDGFHDAVSVGNPPNLQLQNFTIEAWIKRGNTARASQDPWDSGSFFAYAWGGYGFGVTDNGTLFLTKVGYSHVMANSLLVTDTNWHHVAVTKNGSSVVIYLDGASQVLGPYDPGFVFNADAVIGARGDDYVGTFIGSVDEVSVYNRALSGSELQTIYLAGTGGKCPVTSPTNCVPAPTGQLAWWRGESNPLDSAGTNHGTTPFGVSYAPGRVGQAFSFNANRTRVSITDNPQFELTNSLTIEGWVRIAGDGGFILFRGDNRPGLDPYALTMGSSGHLSFHIESLTEAFNLEAPVAYNEWRHVAATFQGENGTMRIYVNGQLAAQTNTSVRPFGKLDPAFEPALGIGNSGGTFHEFAFNGLIDEISLYGRALSQAEVQSIFNAGAAGKCLNNPTGAPPFIVTNPQSFVVNVGANVNFNVVAGGTQPLSYQWRFNESNIFGATGSSLSLSNVQLANAGFYSVRVSNAFGLAFSSNAQLIVQSPSNNCVPAPAGLVSWWRVEGNALDAADGNNGAVVTNASFVPGLVGQALLLHGGIGGILVGNPANLQLQNFTIETWVRRGSLERASFGFNGGEFFAYGAGGYGFGMLDNGRLFLTRVEIDNVMPNVTINDTNWHHVAVTKLFTNVVFFVDGVPYSAPSYQTTYSFTSPAGIGFRGDTQGNTFLGNLDELSIYNRPLAASEIQAIYGAERSGKCVTPQAPFIVSHPASRTVTVGATTIFEVVATGTPPLSYQWRFNGTNIAGANATSLVLSNVQFAQAGLYSVLVSNFAGTALSSNATLAVNFGPTTVRVVNSAGTAGNQVTVPIALSSSGNANALGFSLNFNPAVLSLVGVAPGQNATNATLLVNDFQSSTGRVGIAIALPTGETFGSGTQQVVNVTFQAAVVGSNTTSSISFGDIPILRQLSDAAGNTLQAIYLNGAVSLTGVNFEADVSTRPNGDRNVTITDWVMVGRFAARLEFPTNGTEFQRADCAPRSTLGNGSIGATDWVQAGRYAARLDSLTPVGGPLAPAPTRFNLQPQGPTARQLKVLNASLLQQQPGQVSVSLEAFGDENAISFSLLFDPEALTYTGASLGSSAGGATLNVNAREAAGGRLGVVLALPVGSRFAAGSKELLQVSFRPAEAGNYNVTVGDLPVPREVSDETAIELPAEYVNGTVSVSPVPSLSIQVTADSIQLSWPTWATDYVLQQSDGTPGGSWTTLSPLVMEINGQNVATLSLGSGARFYRLYRQP
jgi:hypothetical protein